ncbi:MAG: CAP domain-containing protein [Acidimicrobiia bacterium]|nr:CAP domain-containing protein [Acidimicrobiia bacterium]
MATRSILFHMFRLWKRSFLGRNKTQMRRYLAALLVVTALSLGGVTAPAAAATNPAAEYDLISRINSYRSSNGIPPLYTHDVLTAKARSWADHMAATGCLCHSTLADGVTVVWRKLGENIARGYTIAGIHQSLVDSAPHRANMLDRQFRYIGVGTAVVGSQLYAVEVFMDGDPAPDNSAALLNQIFDSRGRAIAAREQGGFWVLQGDGVVANYEGAPALGYPALWGNLARDLVAMPDGNGYVVLDGWGGVHRYGSATSLPLGGPYWRDWDIARSLAITPAGTGYTILDGFGGIHIVGTTPRVFGSPYWAGWDIGRAIAYSPSGGLYVLDGFGKVWATSGAQDFGTPYWGWAIARDLTVWPDGKGYAVLDGFGGIHNYGSAKEPLATQYAPIDRWRGITTQLGTYLVIRNDALGQRV